MPKRSRFFRVEFGLAGLLLGAAVLFLAGIEHPATHNFDEFHYVPAAKRILAHTENSNWEHPPLAKVLIAAGIAVFGDRPIGWRISSAIAGVATLGGIYRLGIALGLTPLYALGIAALTLFNQMVFVQARIGMLDTPMTAFLVWGWALWIESTANAQSPRRSLTRIGQAGVLFGFSAACKWFGWIPLFGALSGVVLILLLKSWRLHFDRPVASDWYSPKIWSEIEPWKLFAALLCPALTAYFLTYIPLYKMTGGWSVPWDVLVAQKTMYEGQLRVITSHPYMSTWSQWWLPQRPIWYAFDHFGANKEFVRGVFLLGNPWVHFLGMIALAWGLVRVWSDRDRAWTWVVCSYLAFYLAYAVIPRKILFYFYYYPAALFFPVAIALGVRDAAARLRWRPRVEQLVWSALILGAAGVFVYFYPILGARLIPASEFRRFMWLDSWI